MPPRLNFSGTSGLVDPVTQLGNTLGRYGQLLNQRDAQRTAESRLLEDRARAQEDRQRAITRQELLDSQRLEDRNIASADRQRLINRQDLADQRRVATDEAISAVTNPDAVVGNQLAREQSGINASLANLSPADRAIAEQQVADNYDPNTRRGAILRDALTNENVDQSSVLNARNTQNTFETNQYRRNLLTPGTPEYVANQKAELDTYRQKQEIKGESDTKVAQQGAERVGLYNLYRDAGIKPNPNLTNAQLQAEYNTKTKEIRNKQDRDRELRETGNFTASRGNTVESQQFGYLADRLTGGNAAGSSIFSPGYSNFTEEVNAHKAEINKFIADAKNKLGNKYSDTTILNLLADAREGQTSTSPNDTLLQDALEEVAEQLDLNTTDY